MLSRATYRGSRRKIVLAFDLGTTYSGISYRYALPQFLYLNCLDVPQYPWSRPSTRDKTSNKVHNLPSYLQQSGFGSAELHLSLGSPHRSTSAALRRYPQSSTMIKWVKCVQRALKLFDTKLSRLQTMGIGWRLNGMVLFSPIDKDSSGVRTNTPGSSYIFVQKYLKDRIARYQRS